MPVKPIELRTFIKKEDTKLIKAKQFPIESMYVGTLKRAGKNLMGLCPFHQEKTPSFVIYLETNTYHCFGCGSSGDSVEFYSKLHEVDFKTALEELSK